MKLTAEIIEAFAGVFLSPRYDNPKPTPEFHRESWARYCSSHTACATAAPRGHAKSTALTHDYALAVVLFREEEYVILVGSTEEMAIEHLGEISNELEENEALRRHFKIKHFITQQKTDIIVECEDGHQFRILARGAEQKIRGRKWRGKRPGLILFDDIEDDEQVESRERRKKFRKWFFRACKQSLRVGGKIRGHGTILHEDSLLNRLCKNKSWKTKVYKAHRSFDDFAEILWPDQFPESSLRAKRQEFINEGDAAGYSQEFLNDPTDHEDVYLRDSWFLPMREEFKRIDYFTKPLLIKVGCDFAISKNDTANRTSFTVGGHAPDNTTCIIDQKVDRMDTWEIIEMFFQIQTRHNADIFYVEDGVIWKTLWPVLRTEMIERNIFISIAPINPVKDKAVRGRPMQKRMRAGRMRFDKQAHWYPDYEFELLRFTPGKEAILDDQFDSTATLMIGIEDNPAPIEEDFMTESEEDFQSQALSQKTAKNSGRSKVTGY